MTDQGFGDQAFAPPGSADWEPRRRSGEWGCMKTCFIGCLGIMLVLAIGAFIVWRNSKFGTSKDPGDVARLVKETINADIPEGFEGKMSFNMSVFGFGTRMMVIVPKGIDANEKPDRNPDDADGDDADDPFESDKHTAFVVFALSGVDEETLKRGFENQQGGGKRRKPKQEPEQATTVRVGSRDVPATKVETTNNGVKTIQYQVIVKPGVLFMAMGPADSFDQKAMEAFLASVKD